MQEDDFERNVKRKKEKKRKENLVEYAAALPSICKTEK